MPTNNDLVLYHADCNDGFCAAWIARKELPDAEFIPVQYGQEPPDVLDRDVLILDFSYKRETMRRICNDANSVVVLDHHKTAQAELDGLQQLCQRRAWKDGPVSVGLSPVLIRFDMDKSGGRLAWEYFHRDEPAPWLVDYTEDRDLWRWKLKWSREVNAALAIYPRTFKQWDVFAESPFVLDKLQTEGTAILRYQAQLIDSIAARASEVEMNGYKVLRVNNGVLISEVAGKLAEGRPFGCCWFELADGKRVYSLRSSDGGVDVSEIAQKHGGGGHRNAAGFTISPETARTV